MNYELRENLAAVYKLCDYIEASPYGQNIAKSYNMKIRHIVDADLIAFLTYLSASDGKVDVAETKVVNEYFPHFKLDTNAIVEMIKRFNIHSAEFERIVPRPVKIFVEIDKFGVTEKDRNKPVASSTMYAVYFDLAKELIQCDRDVDSNELRDADTYMKMIKNYIYSKLDV